MLSKNHTGAIAELQACTWLLAQGFEVFRNVSASGPADLVAWRPDNAKTYLIDVKSTNSSYVRADGETCLPMKTGRNPHVHLLYVVSGEVIGFVRKDEHGNRQAYNLLAEEYE